MAYGPYDINIRLGGNGSRKTKTSAQSSEREKNANNPIKLSKKISQCVNTITSMGGTNPTGLIGPNTKAMGVVGILLKSAEKISLFGVDIFEAQTGEHMRASNSKAVIKTVGSGGLNILSGSINNALFIAPMVHRQNLALNYGRELYNQNNYGEKNQVR